MKTLKLKDTIIGEGIPKIAVSITGTSKAEIISQAKQVDSSKVDIIEWRADFYQDVFQIEDVLERLKELRKLDPDMPIIFTFRTLEEGGEKDIDLKYYIELNRAVAKSKDADLIDIEIFLDDNLVKETIKYIQEQGSFVIGSNHDFSSTPKKEDIINRALICHGLGADIIKLAYMPEETEDVIDLLSATAYINDHINKPLITMAMGKLGLISRISGEIFGSSLTFACMGKASAPGQIPVENLHTILHLIH